MNDSVSAPEGPAVGSYVVAFRACPLISLVTTTGRAVIRDANLAATTFFRVDRKVLVGKPLVHFVARGDTRLFRDRVRSLSEVPFESLNVRLRPRGGCPCAMRLRFERAGDALVWWAAPEPRGEEVDRSASSEPSGGACLTKS